MGLSRPGQIHDIDLPGANYVGGVVGYGSRVICCANHGSLSDTAEEFTSQGCKKGGVCGGRAVLIDRCYNSGTVNGNVWR
jgi:hypothetical protein